MALQQVQIVNPKQQYRETAGRKGGGGIGEKLGAVAGGVIGGIAGGVAGNAPGAAAGAMGGATAGAGLGRMVGEAISPSKQGRREAIERRLASQSAPQQINASDRTAQLRQSLMALQSQPPPIQQEFGKPLVAAYMQSAAQDQKKGVV